MRIGPGAVSCPRVFGVATWTSRRPDAFWMDAGTESPTRNDRRVDCVRFDAMLPMLFFILLFLGLWLVLRYWGPAVRAAILRFTRTLGKRAMRVIGDDSVAARIGASAGIVAAATLGILVAWGAANAFLELGELLREETAVLERFDGAVHSNARLWVSADSTVFFRTMTMIGDPPVLGAIAFVAAVILVVRRQRVWAAYLVITVSTGALLNLLLKEWFARERPDLTEALRHATGYSFPSGHSMGAMVVFATLGWLSIRILPTWRQDARVIAFVVTLISAIGISRVYLGVHWLSDVVGGFAAGLAWVATVTTLFELWLWWRGQPTADS